MNTTKDEIEWTKIDSFIQGEFDKYLFSYQWDNLFEQWQISITDTDTGNEVDTIRTKRNPKRVCEKWLDETIGT